MRSTLKLSTYFSKLYDIISIGPYANLASKKAFQNSGIKPSILTIEQNPTIIEPSLMPIQILDPKKKQKCVVKLEQNNSQFSDVEVGVGVREIDAEGGEVVLKNGNRYRYRSLVYSGESRDWRQEKDIQLAVENRDIFNDYQYQNVAQLFLKRGGKVVFTVPKDRHFGYENYFMVFLKETMERNRKGESYGVDPIDITVVCQGDSLCPFNQGYANLVERYLKQNGIKLIKNSSWTVQPSKRTLTHQTGTQIPYSSLFQYLPISTPKLLQASNLEPSLTDPFTLSHKKYTNISIIGNVLPYHVYSITALQQMTETVGRNLVYACNGVRKRVGYDGYTGVNFWVGKGECHHVGIDQGSKGNIRDYGKTRAERVGYAIDRKVGWQWKVNKIVNTGKQLVSFAPKLKEINISHKLNF